MPNDRNIPNAEKDQPSTTVKLAGLREVLQIEDDAEWAGVLGRLRQSRLAVQVGQMLREQDPALDDETIQRVMQLIRRGGEQSADDTGADEECIVVAVPKAYVSYVTSRGLATQTVLNAFAHDLAETELSNGSDERCAANAWFGRVIWPEADEMD